jgi:hypothetical protein
MTGTNDATTPTTLSTLFNGAAMIVVDLAQNSQQNGWAGRRPARKLLCALRAEKGGGQKLL